MTRLWSRPYNLLSEFNITQHCARTLIYKNTPQRYGLDALSRYSLDQILTQLNVGFPRLPNSHSRKYFTAERHGNSVEAVCKINLFRYVSFNELTCFIISPVHTLPGSILLVLLLCTARNANHQLMLAVR